MPRVRVQTADFDLSAEVAALRAGDAGVGAVCAFVGTVREHHAPAASGLAEAGADAGVQANVQAGTGTGTGESEGGGAITALELEHYPGMTERAIEAMIDEAQRRFGLNGARVVHRVGRLRPCDQIVLVAVTAPHRAAAFEGCAFLMDYLKTQAPFWKKEHAADGGSHWVDARESDDAALARWGVAARNLG